MTGVTGKFAFPPSSLRKCVDGSAKSQSQSAIGKQAIVKDQYSQWMLPVIKRIFASRSGAPKEPTPKKKCNPFTNGPAFSP